MWKFLAVVAMAIVGSVCVGCVGKAIDSYRKLQDEKQRTKDMEDRANDEYRFKCEVEAEAAKKEQEFQAFLASEREEFDRQTNEMLADVYRARSFLAMDN